MRVIREDELQSFPRFRSPSDACPDFNFPQWLRVQEDATGCDYKMAPLAALTSGHIMRILKNHRNAISPDVWRSFRIHNGPHALHLRP